MTKLTSIQWHILEQLERRDANPTFSLSDNQFPLKETDYMQRIRELVFHFESLIELGYLEASEPFYEASDKMSFEYMNSAISVDYQKIQLTELGRTLVQEHNRLAQETIKTRTFNFFKQLFHLSIGQWVFLILFGCICFFIGYTIRNWI